MRKPVPTTVPSLGHNATVNQWLIEWTADRRKLEELERLGDALLSDLLDSGWGDGSLISIDAWRKARGTK